MIGIPFELWETWTERKGGPFNAGGQLEDDSYCLGITSQEMEYRERLRNVRALKIQNKVTEEEVVKTYWRLTHPDGRSVNVLVYVTRTMYRHGADTPQEFVGPTESTPSVTLEDRQELTRFVDAWLKFGDSHGFRRSGADTVKKYMAKVESFAATMQDLYARMVGLEATQGPIPPNKFAFDGKEVTLQPKDWEAVNLLWDKPGRTLRRSRFGIEVWGEPEPTKGQLDGLFGRVNRKFDESGIPFSLGRSKSRNGFVTLEDLRQESV